MFIWSITCYIFKDIYQSYWVGLRPQLCAHNKSEDEFDFVKTCHFLAASNTQTFIHIAVCYPGELTAFEEYMMSTGSDCLNMEIKYEFL